MEGWIKLYRKLIENPIFLKPELLQLFIYCLLKANHEAQKLIFNGQEIEIKIGQFITGRNIIAKELKQNPITTYKRLKILENLQILNIKSNNKFSVVTVVNYGLYQSEEIKRNTKRNNKGTTREQQGNTNKNVKNVKKLKNKDIEYTPLFEIAYKNYPRPQAKSDTFRNWNSLLKQYTEEQLLQFAENYKLYFESIPEADRPFAYSSNNFYGRKAYYLDFMEPKLWEGKSKTGPVKGSAKGPVNRGNFEQRKYTDEDFEKMYSL